METIVVAKKNIKIALFMFLLIFCVSIAKFVADTKNDIFWTPMEMAYTPAEARDRVEIYIDGSLLSDNSVHKNVLIRINNTTEVTRKSLILATFGLGASLVLIFALFSSEKKRD